VHEQLEGRPAASPKAALEQLVGPTAVHELVGRPFDLNEISRAIKAALARQQAASQQAGYHRPK